MITVSDLYVYPIKSCAGTRVQTAELTRCGLARDRMLMVIRADGQFVTQRERPKMCLIKPTILQNQMTLSAPGMTELPFVPTQDGAVTTTEVWGDRIDARLQSAEVNAWLSEYLNLHVQLVSFDSRFERKVDREYAVAPTDVVGFADGFSMLLISEASLEQLNEKLDAPVGMNRFRPNIVVTGCGPHAEDDWAEFNVGDVAMSGVKPCARCSVVSVEPTTGERGTQPTATLAEYRRFPQGVMFGMNLVHHAIGQISVGDEVTVTMSRGDD